MVSQGSVKQYVRKEAKLWKWQDLKVPKKQDCSWAPRLCCKERSAAKEDEELGFLDIKLQQYLSSTKKVTLYWKVKHNLH